MLIDNGIDAINETVNGEEYLIDVRDSGVTQDVEHAASTHGFGVVGETRKTDNHGEFTQYQLEDVE